MLSEHLKKIFKKTYLLLSYRIIRILTKQPPIPDYCMVQFVKPNLLGKYNEYLNRFVNPITNGQYTDSTDHDIRIMKRRSHVLHKMLDGAVQVRVSSGNSGIISV